MPWQLPHHHFEVDEVPCVMQERFEHSDLAPDFCDKCSERIDRTKDL